MIVNAVFVMPLDNFFRPSIRKKEKGAVNKVRKLRSKVKPPRRRSLTTFAYAKTVAFATKITPHK